MENDSFDTLFFWSLNIISYLEFIFLFFCHPSIVSQHFDNFQYYFQFFNKNRVQHSFNTEKIRFKCKKRKPPVSPPEAQNPLFAYSQFLKLFYFSVIEYHKTLNKSGIYQVNRRVVCRKINRLPFFCCWR